MTIQMPDYLADLDIQDTQRPPLEILHEAAEKLGETTKGLVTGLVSVLNPGGPKMFRYTFYLLAPRLNDYTDPLFYVWHDDRLYPVNVMMAGGTQGQDEEQFETEDEFVEELQRIFEGEVAKRRIQSLIVTARS